MVEERGWEADRVRIPAPLAAEAVVGRAVVAVGLAQEYICVVLDLDVDRGLITSSRSRKGEVMFFRLVFFVRVPMWPSARVDDRTK